ncbi:MAG: VWA domain-containing protein [Acidobacteria bacterium]|nr:MAG: VWA domain-containing protein [Acidobacteriota bacterium]
MRKWPLLLSFLGVSLLAQRTQEVPSFRGGGLTVLVDVVVTDKNNRVIRDLKPEDFVIYEDDVPQKIENFQIYQPEVRVTAEKKREEQAAAAPIATSPPAEPAKPNLIIILLDYATTDFENQKLVEEASTRYIRENLKPNDLVAVFSLSSSFRFLADFTNDRDALIAALQRRDIGGRSMAGNARTGGGLTATQSQALSEAGPASIATGGSPESIRAAAQAAQAQGSQMAQLMSAERIQNMFYRMGSYLAEREARSVLRAIAAIARGVENIEGRKTLILFSQGFVVGARMEADLDKTVTIANRANLAIYGIDSQGLTTRDTSGELVPSGELSSISAATGPRRKNATGGESLFDRARQVGSDLRDSALRYVSTATGGFAIRNTNDLHIGMKRIDEDIRSYYLLTYLPANQTFDGKFRKIRVEVKRDGATVRARTGYQAVPPGLETVTPDQFELINAAETRQVPFDLPLFMRLDAFQTEKSEQRLLVTLEIPTTAIEFAEEQETDGTKHVGKLELIGLIRDAGGHIVERFGTPVNLHLLTKEYEVLSKGSVSFSNSFDVFPGAYTVEVVTKDARTGKIGLVENSIQVPRRSNQLALSTLVLGKDVEKSEPGAELLASGGTRVLPVARRVFRNGDKLVFFFDVYNFQMSSSKNPKVAVQVALQRLGAKDRVTLPEYVISEASSPASLSVARYIELKGLAAGKYVLTASVADRLAGKTIEGRTTFTLE